VLLLNVFHYYLFN